MWLKYSPRDDKDKLASSLCTYYAFTLTKQQWYSIIYKVSVPMSVIQNENEQLVKLRKATEWRPFQCYRSAIDLLNWLRSSPRQYKKELDYCGSDSSGINTHEGGTVWTDRELFNPTFATKPSGMISNCWYTESCIIMSFWFFIGCG